MVNNIESRGRSHKETISPQPPFSIDDCPGNVSAAGYRNGTSLYNREENGNYWSSTPNESNTQNAYNLNFNSSNRNTNWNNRNNGHTVRPVAELTQQSSLSAMARRFAVFGKTEIYRTCL